MTKTREPATEATLDSSQVTAERGAEIIRPLLTDGDGPVTVTLGYVNEVSNEYIDTLFDRLMQTAMAIGGRRLAIEWMKRLEVQEWAADRAHQAMAKTVNLNLRFGMLHEPLATQVGCRPELLEHEQRDADCIARLAVQGIATDGEVHKMRQRLVKRIMKVVSEDSEPQTVGS